MATVEVDATPSATITPILSQLTLTGSANANNSGVTVESSPAQYVNIVDFTIKATNYTPSIIAGQTATIQVQFCPSNPNLGYSGTVTPSQTTSPSMVTATTPTFTPTPVTAFGERLRNHGADHPYRGPPREHRQPAPPRLVLRHMAPHRRPEPGRTRYRRGPQAPPLADRSCSLPDRGRDPAAAGLRRGQHQHSPRPAARRLDPTPSRSPALPERERRTPLMVLLQVN